MGHVRRQHRGAFLLGYFVTRLQERLPLSAYRRPLLGTGFCGLVTSEMVPAIAELAEGRRVHGGLRLARRSP